MRLNIFSLNTPSAALLTLTLLGLCSVCYGHVSSLHRTPSTRKLARRTAGPRAKIGPRESLQRLDDGALLRAEDFHRENGLLLDRVDSQHIWDAGHRQELKYMEMKSVQRDIFALHNKVRRLQAGPHDKAEVRSLEERLNSHKTKEAELDRELRQENRAFVTAQLHPGPHHYPLDDSMSDDRHPRDVGSDHTARLDQPGEPRKGSRQASKLKKRSGDFIGAQRQGTQGS